MLKNGFTLVELLVVISILGILGILVTDVLVQFLRGRVRTEVINQVKQNGQLVLDQMTKDIRGTSQVLCLGDSDINTDTIILQQTDNSYIRYRFTVPKPVSGPTANGFIIFDKPPAGHFDTLDEENSPCDQPLSSFVDQVNLTDTNSRNGVSINSDSTFGNGIIFKKINQTSGFNDSILINFTASPGVGAGSKDNYESTGIRDSVSFTTAVKIRSVD